MSRHVARSVREARLEKSHKTRRAKRADEIEQMTREVKAEYEAKCLRWERDLEWTKAAMLPVAGYRYMRLLVPKAEDTLKLDAEIAGVAKALKEKNPEASDTDLYISAWLAVSESWVADGRCGTRPLAYGELPNCRWFAGEPPRVEIISPNDPDLAEVLEMQKSKSRP